MSEFKRVGAEVAFGEVAVDLADVQPIRNLAAFSLLKIANSSRIDLRENEGGGVDISCRYSRHFPSVLSDGVDLPDIHLSVALTEKSSPDTSQLSIRYLTYSLDERYSSKCSQYRFESIDDQMVTAKKEVYVVRGRSDVHVEGNHINHVVEQDRKMFERPMTPADCVQVVRMLERAVKRDKVGV
ncbi:hypothetical protein CYG49_04105 [Candidatus Saccharibacteria bacterium]|nr:MAG: hypothetical protein CYG49_04105 [Candidatus Saccharibacteria bacterium]